MSTTKVTRVQGERGWTVVEFGRQVLVSMDRNSTTLSYKKSELSTVWHDAGRYGYTTPVADVLMKAATLADELEK